jgi:hypothetical protein
MRGDGGGVAGSQPMSAAKLHTGDQINFGDLTQYLTYDKNSVILNNNKYCKRTLSE